MSEKESIGVEDMRASREPTLSAEMWTEKSKVMKPSGERELKVQ